MRKGAMAVNKASEPCARPYSSEPSDGSDVALVDVQEDGVVVVELQGACKGCPMSQMTLANGVERILKEHVPGVTKVVPA